MKLKWLRSHRLMDKGPAISFAMLSCEHSLMLVFRVKLALFVFGSAVLTTTASIFLPFFL
ncbi:hypothetical protein ACA30_08125 [Virgibacillus soli]|uniref:Uncharacterized protein n=1 Tax=Lederbergia galactosidilytica TaxID=217031 RepID=A0A177ZIV9_9BACI|nr:hypothetical protein ACA30_08125 [Virgibacillus soli]OAK67901.1 hypothetical protein ABB05_17830 [Lederbergia galactosidilytica]